MRMSTARGVKNETMESALKAQMNEVVVNTEGTSFWVNIVIAGATLQSNGELESQESTADQMEKRLNTKGPRT